MQKKRHIYYISFEVLENFKVVDGKIAETWCCWPDKEIEEKLQSAD